MTKPEQRPLRALDRPQLRAAGPDDAALVQAVQAGERAAFDELYRRHVQTVYARLTRLVGWTPEREDLIQQVFWHFYSGLSRYRGEATVSAFLHGIVVHVAYQALRKRRTGARAFGEHEIDQLIAPDATPEARARQRQELARVFRLLDRLKPKKRIAFVLHVIEGLPLTEVAELTSSQPRAVGQRVAYARRELVRMLQREDGSSGGEP